MGCLGTVTEAALICYLIELDTGVPPRDAVLNEFMYELANRDQRDAQLKQFQAAGGRHMGSRYDTGTKNMY
jgi:hypothetical protein